MADIYRFRDGRAAARFVDGRCRVYESYQGLVEWFEQTERDAERGFSWESVIPMGRSFPSEVKTLVGDRQPWMGGGTGLPDLATIERAIRRLGQEGTLTPEVFPYVLAHVGEAIRAQLGGEWKTRDCGHGPEPYLDLGGGRKCLVTTVYKQILELGRRVSIVAYVQHEVWSRGG